MTPSRPFGKGSALAAVAVLVLCAGTASAQGKPVVRELRTQRVGEVVYFHLTLQPPADMSVPAMEMGPYSEGKRRRLGLVPELVPQDGKTAAVYPRVTLPHALPMVQFKTARALPGVNGLEFVGKLHGKNKARFLLLYPTAQSDPDAIKDGGAVTNHLPPARWVETPLKLNFADATVLPPPREDGDDLEKLWAAGQAAKLAILEAQAPDFSFFGFACAATGRKYGVPDPVLEGERLKENKQVYRQMFDLTTGSSAITQSLALDRLRRADFPDRGPRTLAVASVPGIDIAEHPWQRMMGDKKPAPEPLAGLVPHDNYYLHFRSFAKFLEFGDLLDQWGTSAARAYEMTSRDLRLKERYERQLCLHSSWLGRVAGPLLVRAVAVTGSDPYIREGSDVTVLFQVNNRTAFLAGVNTSIEQARKEFGSQLVEGKETYRRIVMERYVSPLREISVHRASFDDFVIYSNSAVALRRVIDTYSGVYRSLWDSMDFKYMRTAFPLTPTPLPLGERGRGEGDREEDGFGFLSDAFIRQLVGPASKIKEARRLEALTSLAMVNNAALFGAWETGKLPADHKALLAGAQLLSEHIYVPEGKEIRWDGAKQTAVSDVFNTLHFATPLIELPIDKITHHEEQGYREFRQAYLRLWQQFFDPVGMRLSMNEKRVKMEVYILPLINNEQYRNLRWLTGQGTTNLDRAEISPRSLLHFKMHHAFAGVVGLSDWAMVRLDDGPNLKKLAELWIQRDLFPQERPKENNVWGWLGEFERLFYHLPLTAGVGVRKFEEFEQTIRFSEPYKFDKKAYKQGAIERYVFGPENHYLQYVNERHPEAKFSSVSVFKGKTADARYIGLGEAAMRDLIDLQASPRPKNKPIDDNPINVSLHVAPGAAVEGRTALELYLAWETHKRARPNTALWYALYRCGLIDADTPEPAKHAAAMKFLGFVPVSPDDAGYTYDRRTGDVSNDRHGSLRRPLFQATSPLNSPLLKVLGEFPAVRVDMRFREDGMHTTLTLERSNR